MCRVGLSHSMTVLYIAAGHDINLSGPRQHLPSLMLRSSSPINSAPYCYTPLEMYVFFINEDKYTRNSLSNNCIELHSAKIK